MKAACVRVVTCGLCSWGVVLVREREVEVGDVGRCRPQLSSAQLQPQAHTDTDDRAGNCSACNTRR